MSNLFKQRRLHSLIVTLAILLNLFVPAISHATRDPLALEMCSTTKTAPAKSPSHAMKHCVFCATHADTYAPPPPASGLQTVLHGHDAYPSLHYQSPSPLFNWSSAQPRGPPALS